MKWIKTSDRLPEKDGVYIVTIIWGDNELVRSESKFTVDGFAGFYDEVIEPMTFYDEYDQPMYGYHETYYSPLNVIAWMPYPEPYNPAEEEL